MSGGRGGGRWRFEGVMIVRGGKDVEGDVVVGGGCYLCV